MRAGSAVVLVALLAVFVGQSLPLRHHQEHGGAFETTQRIAGAAGGRQGVFLWEQAPQGLYNLSYLFGGAVWLQQGQVSALLPTRPRPAYVRSFVRGFPGQPVLLVTAGHGVPSGYASLGLRRVDQITYVMPVWEETYETRPVLGQRRAPTHVGLAGHGRVGHPGGGRAAPDPVATAGSRPPGSRSVPAP